MLIPDRRKGLVLRRGIGQEGDCYEDQNKGNGL